MTIKALASTLEARSFPDSPHRRLLTEFLFGQSTQPSTSSSSDRHSSELNLSDRLFVHWTNQTRTGGKDDFLNEFESIYIHESVRHRDARVFFYFHDAYAYGKTIAQLLGFDVRIKTSSLNSKHGLVHKYCCCVREGAPLSHTVPESERVRNRESVRCGCPWMTKLVGVRLSQDEFLRYLAAAGSNLAEELKQRQQRHPWDGCVWFWDRAVRSFPHNHDMFDCMKPSPSMSPHSRYQTTAANRATAEVEEESGKPPETELRRAAPKRTRMTTRSQQSSLSRSTADINRQQEQAVHRLEISPLDPPTPLEPHLRPTTMLSPRGLVEWHWIYQRPRRLCTQLGQRGSSLPEDPLPDASRRRRHNN